MDSEQLLARVERLERSNRRLTLALGGTGALLVAAALVGFQQAPSQVYDLVRVKKLEVVDDRGVPMVTLDTGRGNQGGSIMLRDALGERRGWWQTSPDGSSLAMTHINPDTEKGATAGLSASPNSAEVNLIGPDGSLLNGTAKPRIELWNSEGKVVFSAPLQRGDIGG